MRRSRLRLVPLSTALRRCLKTALPSTRCRRQNPLPPSRSETPGRCRSGCQQYRRWCSCVWRCSVLPEGRLAPGRWTEEADRGLSWRVRELRITGTEVETSREASSAENAVTRSWPYAPAIRGYGMVFIMRIITASIYRIAMAQHRLPALPLFNQCTATVVVGRQCKKEQEMWECREVVFS